MKGAGPRSSLSKCRGRCGASLVVVVWKGGIPLRLVPGKHVLDAEEWQILVGQTKTRPSGVCYRACHVSLRLQSPLPLLRFPSSLFLFMFCS